jgi:hypothetical protein
MQQAEKLGVPSDFLDVMVREGYVEPLVDLRALRGPVEFAAGGEPAARPAPAVAGIGVAGLVPPALARAAASASAAPSGPISDDELARFRAAKSFMNETVVNALGFRAFMFTLRLERCATRPELAQLLPDYEKALRKGAGAAEAQVLVQRMRELLA